MKIVYIIHQFYPKYYTGTEKFVLNLARMMQLFGHKVKIITFNPDESSKFTRRQGDMYLQEYLYRSLPVLSFRFKQFDPQQNMLLRNKKLHRFSKHLLSDEKPDIIHVAHVQQVGEFVNSSIELGIPYVMTLTDFWLLCPNSILVTSAGNLCLGPKEGNECLLKCLQYSHEMIVRRIGLAKKYLSCSRKIIAPSNFLGNIFLQEYSTLAFNVIPYGMQYQDICMNTKTYNHDENLVIGYAGSLNAYKGVQILISAFKNLKKKTLRLKVYGSFGMETELKQLAKSDQRVQFCGVFSEDKISEFFNSIDLLVVPSLWYENNTIIMRESLSHNVPVVVSDVGGMTETITDGVNGFTFKVGSSEDLKNVLEKIIEKPEMLNTIKDNIQYHLPITIEQEAYLYEREYRRILQPERGKS